MKKIVQIDRATNEVNKAWIYPDSYTLNGENCQLQDCQNFQYKEETAQTGMASPGYLWHTNDGIFTTPKPYPSWVLEGWVWQAPIPMQDDGNEYEWDEENQAWEPLPVFIDVNTANETELQALNEVGPVLAASIVTERTRNGPFSSLLDLASRVDGITATTVNNWTNAHAEGDE